jgi:acyl dehydratase
LTTAKRTVTTVAELKELVGQELGVSDWVEITQERVNLFAEATGDFQYIHVDPERAAQTFFGGTVAHGFLTLSLALPYSAQSVQIDLGGVMEVNYGLNKVRFPAPVRVGQRIRKRSRLVAGVAGGWGWTYFCRGAVGQGPCCGGSPTGCAALPILGPWPSARGPHKGGR